MRREFIVLINSDVFKNLLMYIVNSKMELMLMRQPVCESNCSQHLIPMSNKAYILQ